MADKSLGAVQILRPLKPKLISILSGQADFVLQHADSRSLVTRQAYRQIKSCHVPDMKIRDLLDHVIDRGPEAAQGLLELLKNQELQETFPLLHFVKSVQTNACPGEEKNARRKWKKVEEERRNKRKPEKLKEVVPPKKSFNTELVTEKELMTVARAIGQSWREVAIVALEVPSVKLEQFVADNPNCQVNQVFAALRYWRNIQRNRATASCLHSLLSQPHLALSQEAFNFLLEKN